MCAHAVAPPPDSERVLSVDKRGAAYSIHKEYSLGYCLVKRDCSLFMQVARRAPTAAMPSPASASALRPLPRSPPRSPRPNRLRPLDDDTLRLARTANVVDEYVLHESLGNSAAFQVRRTCPSQQQPALSINAPCAGTQVRRATRRANGQQCAIKLLQLSDAVVTPRGVGAPTEMIGWGGVSPAPLG